MKKIYLLLSSFLVCLLSISQNQYPTSWLSRGVGGGGALFSPTINPANSNEYYIASDMSDIFHTTDFGQHYDQLNFQQILSGSYDKKVCFTNINGLLYSINSTQSNAIPVKSSDNGQTWTTMPGNPDASDDVFTIDADFNNPNRVILTFWSTIYFSNDGGNSFNLIHTALNSGSGIIEGGVFFDKDTIYIGTNDGLLVSKNGGTSFALNSTTGIPSTEGIFTFAGARTGNTIRLYCLTGTKSSIYGGQGGGDCYGFLAGVYTLDNNSGSWQSKLTGIAKGTDDLMFVGMAQNDINTCYLAGGSSSSAPDIMKTTDGGANWFHVFNTINNQNIRTGWAGAGGDHAWSFPEYPFEIAVAAKNSSYAIFGDLSCVHKTTDGGQTWEQAYTDLNDEHPAGANTPTGKYYHGIGLENTSCWQIFWIDQNNMFACYSDIRGIRSTDGGNSWSFNYSGTAANTIYRIVKIESTGTFYAATSNIHDMYESTHLKDAQLDATDSQGKIIFSTDNGQTWNDMYVFNHPVFWIASDPTDNNTLYASVINYSNGTGVGGIYVSHNISSCTSSTWIKLSNPPRTQGHPASIVVLKDGNVVCTYSGRIDASTGKFTNSSGVFIYNPSNSTWSDVSDPGMDYWTKDIVIDPNNASQNTWYAGVFSGWGGAPNGLGGLYRTYNRGQSWTRINNLDRVTSITFNPTDTNQIYLTTEYQGLWTSMNISSANPQFTLLESYPFKQPERVFINPYNANEIWISSFGNGMKVGNLTSGGIILYSISDKENIEILPNPSNGIFKITMTENAKLRIENEGLRIYNIAGKTIYSLNTYRTNTNLDLGDIQSGLYFVKVLVENKVYMKKIVIIK